MMGSMLQRSQALGKVASGMRAPVGFGFAGFSRLGFRFRFLFGFLAVRLVCFTGPNCRDASDASKTSLLSDQCL